MIPLRVVQVGKPWTGSSRCLRGSRGSALHRSRWRRRGSPRRREAGRLLRNNPFAQLCSTPSLLTTMVSLRSRPLSALRCSVLTCTSRSQWTSSFGRNFRFARTASLAILLFGSIAEEKLALGGLEARELRRAHTGDIVHQGRIPGDLKQAVRRGLVGRRGQVYIAVGGHGAALHGSDALRGKGAAAFETVLRLPEHPCCCTRSIFSADTVCAVSSISFFSAAASAVWITPLMLALP